MLPPFKSGRGSKKNPVWRGSKWDFESSVGRGILMNLIQCARGYKEIFFSRERVNNFSNCLAWDSPLSYSLKTTGPCLKTVLKKTMHRNANC